MKRPLLLMTLASVLPIALSACGTSAPESVEPLRRIVGTKLVGAKGATPDDQNRIDTTIVGMCAGRLLTKPECHAHGEATQGKRSAQ